jgi:hypothetical protein
MGIPVSLLMLRHEHLATDRPGLAWVIAGRAAPPTPSRADDARNLGGDVLLRTLLSIVTLGIARQIRIADVLIACALIPIIIVASLLGRRAHDILDRGWMRPAVLVFAAVSALVVIATAIW